MRCFPNVFRSGALSTTVSVIEQGHGIFVRLIAGLKHILYEEES